MKSEIAQRLKKARINAGYETAQQFCDALNITYATYVNHENGTRGIKTDAIKKYAEAMNVDIEWLLTGHESFRQRNPHGYGAGDTGYERKSLSSPQKITAGEDQSLSPGSPFAQAAEYLDQFDTLSESAKKIVIEAFKIIDKK